MSIVCSKEELMEGYGRGTHVRFRNVFGTSDPFYRVPDLLNGIDQAAHIAGDIVEEVDCGHCVVD